MKEAYVIASSELSIDRLGSMLSTSDGTVVAFSAPGRMVLELPDDLRGSELLWIEAESYDSLADEWYEDDPICDRLLKNEHFDNSSTAFYVKATRTIRDSELFRWMMDRLLSHGLRFRVYDCHKDEVAGADFYG